MKDPKAITLKEFHDWLKENRKHTWCLIDMAGWGKGSTHLIKYFDLGFDTRTMDIFRIGARGSFEGDMEFHVADCADGQNLLDLLNDRIKEELGNRG